jgi:hypothetical protein
MCGAGYHVLFDKDKAMINAAAGSPIPSTFIKAIEAGNFTTWPTLTSQHVKK